VRGPWLTGVIELDPRKLLEDGIRKQLVQQIAEAFHNELVFTVKEVGMLGAGAYTRSSFRLNVSAFCGIGAAFRGCLRGV
jgi:hypothetical protein